MTVVAVIGILSAIGFPTYKRFQAKARQVEAKASLAALYTAEASFFLEWNLYSVNLRIIGFGVSGSRLRYATGFNLDTCTSYTTSGGAPPEFETPTTSRYTWSCGDLVNVNPSQQATNWNLPTNWTIDNATHTCTPTGATQPLGTNSSCSNVGGSQGYTAAAVGDPNSTVGATSVDGWTMTNLKVLRNSSPGIN